ncbi:TAXI family TRAP transporter solute-binding subunit [Brevibacterium litoralis]|uniref:TAXI family TRAP transporter solute-binding subunit n=1 Tax=Brevibacterium litoralis TaxID=3138935 RepID=UPI0032EF4D9B
MKIGRIGRVGALVAAAALALTACSDGGSGDAGSGGGSGDFTFASGGTGGVYYPLANEYANIFNDNIEGVTVNAVESDGSVDNLGRIARGDAQIALTQNNTAVEAVTGTGQFADLDADMSEIGWIGKLYPEAAQVITMADSGIESIEDLAGKRVAIGAPGSGARAVAEAILDEYGITDFEAYEEGFADARTLMQDGNLDASIEILGVPAAALSELAATSDVQVLPLSQEAADAIAETTAFEPYTIPAGTYDFVEEDTLTVSVFASVVASNSAVSEDQGYEITKAIFERSGEISLAQGDLINLEEALMGQGEVPLHPGAQKYFEEQGLL